MGIKKILKVALILTVCNLCSASDQFVTLNDMLDWQLVVPGDAIQSEKYAAKEFNSFFKSITGKELEIVNYIPQEGTYVLIGQTELLKFNDLGKGGLRIKISADSLIITGGRPRGVLYGVYEFFEKYIGIRFLTAEHTYVPNQAAKTILPFEEYSYLPPLKFRWSYYWQMRNNAFATRLRTNTIQENPDYGWKCNWGLITHSFHELLPVKKFGATHPEYFMFYKGRRAVDYTDGWGQGSNPCYASKGALDVITNSVIEYFKAHPCRENISLSCVDSHAHCECPQCTIINQRHGGPSGSHFDFVNKVARRIKKECPGKYVGSLAYFHTRHAPKNLTLENNVQIQLATIKCCTLHALDDPDCPRNALFYKDLNDWGKICKNILIWNYGTNFKNFNLPSANLRSMGCNIKILCDHNVKGIFVQANDTQPGGEFGDLRNYVISRCLWKPGLDSWELAMEFCRLHYQESAGPIMEWLTILHDHCEKSGVHFRASFKPSEMNLTPELALKAFECFEQAMRLAKTAEVRTRVEKASICAYVAMLEAYRLHKKDMLKQNPIIEYEELVGKFTELVKKYNVTHASERQNIGDYLLKLDR